MFIAVFFITAKTWMPPKRPSFGKWVNCDKVSQWNSIQHEKQKGKTNRNRKPWNYQIMRRTGKNLNVSEILSGKANSKFTISRGWRDKVRR